MVYLYIDESGDLGFSGTGSEYFVITCIRIKDEKTNVLYKGIIKEVRQAVLKKKSKKLSELKFSNSSLLIRERFLTRAAKLDIEVFSLIIKKEFTQQKLKDNLPILYSYLIRVIIDRAVTPSNDIHICLDKCMSTSQMENFQTYIQTEFYFRFKEVPKLKIIHENSNCNEALQVTDFICGAFGYKYNTAHVKGDFEHYTNLIKGKVILEKNDLFKKK